MIQSALSLPRSRRSRRPSLTPMIDVVFLLLVFFMLASRFGSEGVIAIGAAGSGAGSYSGPPRLVDIAPEVLMLNGIETGADTLAARLGELTETPADTIVLRPRDGADVQRVVAVMEALSDAGFTGLVLVE